MKGSVYQRGSTWHFRFRSPEKDPATGKFTTISGGGFRTEKEAWRACRKAIDTAEQGRIVKKSARTVADFMTEWLAGHNLSFNETTWRNWSDYATTYVMPPSGGARPGIGDVPLQALKTPELMRFYVVLLTTGRIKRDTNGAMHRYWSRRVARDETPTAREIAEACDVTINAARAAVRRYKIGIVPKREHNPGLARKSVRNIHAMLHRAFEDAVAWKYIDANPAAGAKLPTVPKRRAQVWTPAQIGTFMRAIRSDRFYALFRLELTTGMRRANICGQRWGAVDLDAGELSIYDSRVVVGGYAVDKDGGKTENVEHIISLDPVTVAALREWKAVQDAEREFFGGDYLEGDYVFTWPDGRPVHPDSIYQRFVRLTAAAGLPLITFHDLRHSYATAALKAGVNPKVVSERIGHADVAFTLKTYAHVLPGMDREAAERVATYLLDGIGPSDDESG